MRQHSHTLTRKSAATIGVAAVAVSLMTVMAPSADASVYTPNSHRTTTFATGATPSFDEVLVNGAGGYSTSVTATLYGLKAPDAANLDIMLVSPDGTALPLLSDACGGAALTDVDLTFDDTSSPAPQTGGCGNGTSYRPTNLSSGAADRWGSQPNSTTLGQFEYHNPNGVWKLYLSDDQGVATSASAVLLRGFSLTIITSPFQELIPGSGTSGVANPYPMFYGVAGRTGTVTDINVTLRGVSHTGVGDIDAIVVSPSNTAVWLTSDACGQVSETLQDWTFDDQAASTLPAQGTTSTCGTGTYKPSAFADGDSDTLPAPAPAGPYSSSLSAFNGQDPNGNWRVFIVDDHDGTGGGYLTGLSLQITSAVPAAAPAASTPAAAKVVLAKDASAPNTRIIQRKHFVFRRTASFAFGSNESPVTYQCKFDTTRWAPCSQKVRFENLTAGRHYLKVRAVDAAGNVDRSPARRGWLIL